MLENNSLFIEIKLKYSALKSGENTNLLSTP